MEQENMIERIFNLVPIEYMIPYTEEWKNYDKKYELNYYNQIFRLEIPVKGATDYAYIYIYILIKNIYIYQRKINGVDIVEKLMKKYLYKKL